MERSDMRAAFPPADVPGCRFAPSGLQESCERRAVMTRWRTTLDRLIVLIAILAVWQLASFLVGPYWVSSPGAVAARFAAQLWSGELIRHGGYTIEESLIGTLVGGAPAVLLPFLLRRHPLIVAVLDPFMVGGYGAPKL